MFFFVNRCPSSRNPVQPKKTATSCRRWLFVEFVERPLCLETEFAARACCLRENMSFSAHPNCGKCQPGNIFALDTSLLIDAVLQCFRNQSAAWQPQGLPARGRATAGHSGLGLGMGGHVAIATKSHMKAFMVVHVVPWLFHGCSMVVPWLFHGCSLSIVSWLFRAGAFSWVF